MRPPPPELPDDPFSDDPDFILGVEGYYLDIMPYVERRWTCAWAGCTRHTKVRDYGHPTMFRFRKLWCGPYHYYLCAAHTRAARSRHRDLLEDPLEGHLKPLAERSVLTGEKRVNFDTWRTLSDNDHPLKT